MTMDGITIITEHLVRATELKSAIGLGILFAILIFGALYIYYRMYKECYKCVAAEKRVKRCIIVCSTILIALAILLYVSLIKDYNTTHMEYTVTVDDSVRFNDFHDKYEIVSMSDDFIRVKEKVME